MGAEPLTRLREKAADRADLLAVWRVDLRALLSEYDLLVAERPADAARGYAALLALRAWRERHPRKPEGCPVCTALWESGGALAAAPAPPP